MTSFRRLLLDHRRLALLLALAALALKLLVPTGFMVTRVGGHAVLQVCDGVVPAPMTHGDRAAPMADMGHGAKAGHHGPAHRDGHHSGAGMPCPYAALAQAAVAAVDPLLLAVAVALAIATAVHHVRRLPSRVAPRLRPPSRAPPIPA